MRKRTQQEFIGDMIKNAENLTLYLTGREFGVESKDIRQQNIPIEEMVKRLAERIKEEWMEGYQDEAKHP